MKNSFLVFFFVVLILSLSGLKEAQGQCPDGSWTDAGCIPMTIDGCDVEVCYCYRILTVGSTVIHYDYHVYKVEIAEDCNIFDWADVPDLYDKASVELVFLNPQGFPCPDCPEYNFKYRSWRSECLKIISGEEESIPLSTALQSADYIVSSDCGDLNYCVQGYAICCDPITHLPQVVAYGDPVVIEGDDECEGDFPITGFLPMNTCLKFVTCD